MSDRFVPTLTSVVIPAYNCADVIGVQLAALAAQDHDGPWEIVVADNRSTDDTAQAAQEWADRLPVPLRVVPATEAQGVSHARNAGARAAAGDLIAICDADDQAEPGWLGAMVAASAELDVIGGWLDPGPLNDELTRAWRDEVPRHDLPLAEGWLPFAMGANCAVRRACFEAIGGWREDYARGGDDVEFSWRAVLAGYRVGAAPDAVIAYRYRTGIEALWKQYEGYGLASPRLYRDYGSRGMPKNPLRDALAGYKQLVTGVPAALRNDVARGDWVRRAAYRWGKLKGSWRYRVVHL